MGLTEDERKSLVLMRLNNAKQTLEDAKIIVGQKLLSIPSLKSTEATIDVRHLANGVYFLKVNNQMVKFIKE